MYRGKKRSTRQLIPKAVKDETINYAVIGSAVCNFINFLIACPGPTL